MINIKNTARKQACLPVKVKIGLQASRNIKSCVGYNVRWNQIEPQVWMEVGKNITMGLQEIFK